MNERDFPSKACECGDSRFQGAFYPAFRPGRAKSAEAESRGSGRTRATVGCRPGCEPPCFATACLCVRGAPSGRHGATEADPYPRLGQYRDGRSAPPAVTGAGDLGRH